MKKKQFALLMLTLLSIFNTSLSTARAQGTQGTAFTYQGRLNDGGNPANGSYDLQFGLWNAPNGPAQFGNLLTNTAVAVSNGLFSVLLDFGNQFPGQNRWLEIAVRTNGGGAFTTLASRQLITATPYAITAISAGTAANVGPGSVVKSLNSLRDDLTLQAGNNISITPSGNTLTIAAANGGGSSIWSQLGTNAYYSTGRVGVGTSAPQTPLEVNGILRSTRSNLAAQYVQLEGGDPTSIRLTAQSAVSAEKSLVVQNLSGEVTPGANNSIQFAVGTTAAPATKMTITKDGNVILPLGGSGGSLSFGTPNFETGMTFGGPNRADIRFDGSTLKLVTSTGGIPTYDNGIAITTSGNVGIGTSVAPVAKLDVETTTPGLLGIKSRTTSGVAVDGHSDTANGVVGTSSTGVGVYGVGALGQAVFAQGDAGQSRDKGGFVKAMVLIHVQRTSLPYVDTATITRCFNGIANTSSGNCGFAVSADRTTATVDFGFAISDRFISATGSGDPASIYSFPTTTSVQILCGIDNTVDVYVFVF